MEEPTKAYEKELKELEGIAKAAELDLKNAPQGILRVIRNNNTDQYYWRKDSKDVKGKYIRKREEELIKSLAQKEYAQKVLTIIEPVIEKKKKAITQMEGPSVEVLMTGIYKEISMSKKKLITPYIYGEEKFVRQWENEKRKSKEKQENTELDSEIYTEKGECVRSKSEKILADKLYMMNIPYLYEVPLYLSGYGYINPDFIVLNKRTREEYYWEHFGMMDDPEYCEKAIRKVESYQKAGFFPGKNLLLTYETSKHPLNIKIVEKLAEEYLL